MATDSSDGRELRHPVKGPTAQAVVLSPAQLAANLAEEDSLMNQVLKRTPPESRKQLAELLAPQSSYRALGADNSHTAKLMTRIYELRDAREKSQRIVSSRALAKSSRASVTVLLSAETMPQTSVVLRRTDAVPRNIILLSATATPVDLVAAMSAFVKSRAVHGDDPDGSLRLFPSGGDAALNNAKKARSNAVFARLSRAKVKTIAGVGTGRAIRINVPPAVTDGRW